MSRDLSEVRSGDFSPSGERVSPAHVGLSTPRTSKKPAWLETAARGSAVGNEMHSVTREQGI